MNKFLEKVKTKVDIKIIKEMAKLFWNITKFIIFIYGVLSLILLPLLVCFYLLCMLEGIPLNL